MTAPPRRTRLFLSKRRGGEIQPFDLDMSFLAGLHRDLSAADFDLWFDRVSIPSRRLAFHQESCDALAADSVFLIVNVGQFPEGES
jgi:hypothetical protein